MRGAGRAGEEEVEGEGGPSIPNQLPLHGPGCELSLPVPRPQIITRNLTTEEVSVFSYGDWLSRTKGSKRTMVCEMAAVVDEEEMVELTTYTIQVKTSDVAGQSDAMLVRYVSGGRGARRTHASIHISMEIWRQEHIYDICKHFDTLYTSMYGISTMMMYSPVSQHHVFIT